MRQEKVALSEAFSLAKGQREFTQMCLSAFRPYVRAGFLHFIYLINVSPPACALKPHSFIPRTSMRLPTRVLPQENADVSRDAEAVRSTLVRFVWRVKETRYVFQDRLLASYQASRGLALSRQTTTGEVSAQLVNVCGTSRITRKPQRCQGDVNSWHALCIVLTAYPF